MCLRLTKPHADKSMGFLNIPKYPQRGKDVTY